MSACTAEPTTTTGAASALEAMPDGGRWSVGIEAAPRLQGELDRRGIGYVRHDETWIAADGCRVVTFERSLRR